MPILRDPERAGFDNVFVVQAQSNDRSPACRRQTNHMDSAIFPAKMCPPTLGTGIKERDKGLGKRVTGMGTCAFEFVATVTGSAEIIRRIVTARRARRDVIHNQGHCDQTPGRSAIFATRPGPEKDLFTEGTGHSRHSYCTGMASLVGTG